MISKIHPILLIDPPHRQASVKGRDARIVVGIQASGSCLRYGLEVRLHRDTASSHKSLLRGGGKKYAACLQCYFFPLLVICLFLPLFLSPHTIHEQLCLHRYTSWWGLLTIPTTPASWKRGEGDRSWANNTALCLGLGHHLLPVARDHWSKWEKQFLHWGEQTEDRHIFILPCIHSMFKTVVNHRQKNSKRL